MPMLLLLINRRGHRRRRESTLLDLSGIHRILNYLILRDPLDMVETVEEIEELM